MSQKMVVFEGANLIDGKHNEVIENSRVIIKDDRIENAGSIENVPCPEKSIKINVSGKTIMPGMIDSHIHFLGLRKSDQNHWVIDEPYVRAMRCVLDAWRVLDSGFTTVRDLGGMLGLYLKRAIEENSVIGPRIFAAGLIITQTGGHADWQFVPKEWSDRVMLGRVADGVAEVRKAAREQLREGADWLKIMTSGGVMSERDTPKSCQFNTDEIRAFVQEAHNAGVKTASHAIGLQGIKNALRCGINTIEHGIYLDDECIEMMLEQQTYLVPTFAIVDAIVSRGEKYGVHDVSIEKAKGLQADHLVNFKKAYKAGVRCGLGTDYLSDYMSPLGEGAVELELYVTKAGLTPMEAIKCATKNNAELLGVGNELGTIEKGKKADFLVVNGNPLENISLLKRENKAIELVYKSGKKIPRLLS